MFNVDNQCVFSSMQSAFALAESKHRSKMVEWSCILAGHAVQMRVVGRRLWERLNLPFAHLSAAETDVPSVDLRIELWDTKDTGIPCPLGSTDGNFSFPPSFTLSELDRFVGRKLRNSIICLDRASSHIVGCVSDAELLSLYEAGRPLHAPLTVWHNDRGIPVIHAGLVSIDGKGALFAGSGGAGKSTSALTCLFAGFEYLSDDLMALEAVQQKIFVGHSLYNSTFLEADHFSRFPSLEAFSMSSQYAEEEKRLVLLSQVFPGRLKRVTPIGAVVLPRVIASGYSSIHRVSKAEALLALAPSTILVRQISSGIPGFKKLASLVEEVPCYRLDLGRDLSDIPTRVRDLLAA